MTDHAQLEHALQALAGHFSPQSLRNRMRVFMATPQIITDDLAALDQDATAAANAATAKATTASALTAATTDDQSAAATLNAAQQTQAQQLAKTIADLTATYGG
jgi:hypothetical protein